MLSELETQLQDVMLRDQFRFRRQFEQLKRAERQQRLNEEKDKLRRKKDSETAFTVLALSFFIILAIFVYLLFSQMDS